MMKALLMNAEQGLFFVELMKYKVGILINRRAEEARRSNPPPFAMQQI